MFVEKQILKYLTSAEEYPDEEYLDTSKSSSLGVGLCREKERESQLK